jgi:hypothetical protein
LNPRPHPTSLAIFGYLSKRQQLRSKRKNNKGNDDKRGYNKMKISLLKEPSCLSPSKMTSATTILIVIVEEEEKNSTS